MNLEMNHIHIRCQDPEESLAFYTETLGGDFLGRSESLGMPILRVGLGGLNIALSPPREEITVEPFTGRPAYGAYQIGFTVEDLDKAYQDLKAKGVEFTSPPAKVHDNLKAAFLTAPDGVEIELMELC